MKKVIQSRSELLSFLKALGMPVETPWVEVKKNFPSVRSSFYPFEIVEFGAAHLLPGQVNPFWTCKDFPEFPLEDSDLLPPPSYAAFFSLQKNGRENHHEVKEYLENLMGHAHDVSIEPYLIHEWNFENAHVQIQTPPGNPDTVVHPELASFCELVFEPRDLPPLTPNEQNEISKLQNFSSMDQKITILPNTMTLWSAAGCRGIHRLLDAESPTKKLGVTSDLDFLVGVDSRYAWMIQKSNLVSLELTRVLPARGEGGSSLNLQFTDPLSSIKRTETIYLASSGEPTGLNLLADEIAQWAGLKLSVAEYMNA